MAERGWTRRQFLERAALMVAVAGVSPVLAGCDDRGGESGGSQAESAGELDCSDVSGLNEAERLTRNGLQYVERSEKADQSCLNCMQWLTPESPGECGLCSLVPGPIHPAGWCLSWSAKT